MNVCVLQRHWAVREIESVMMMMVVIVDVVAE